MKNVISAGRLWKDRRGSTYLEFTMVFPLLMLTAFCTVDFALIMFDWAQANKAAKMGARMAVVAEPVADGITNLAWDPLLIGDDCANPDTGTNENCPTITSTTCTNVNCSNYTFDGDAFNMVYTDMQRVFPRLEPENVRITYRPTSLGFSGRPGGLPMEVTVEIRCMTHQVFFLAALAGWVFTPRQGCPDDDGAVPLPTFATTLTTEALGS